MGLKMNRPDGFRLPPQAGRLEDWGPLRHGPRDGVRLTFEDNRGIMGCSCKLVIL
ncbi:MAG: hypothetical protein UW84_C0056G0004 [Candidatus Collierbacteria bacterium GW2011_GWA2_44_99]|uniref:Uncharacterized protein n=1 Tax=Candidatus Collierbacteria bacterium GW2011_GWA2_44_99 TaxID=1618380 RepID=A0A0G1NK39_9BACT|nr:MAG: hypothetical protein UW84_C0056G0004 [Candidatus Collierbacteria bacterium GW2011_GWA2_44_99]